VSHVSASQLLGSHVSTATMSISLEQPFLEMNLRSGSSTAIHDGNLIVGVTTVSQDGEKVLEGTAEVA
jgi:hypothetical protein